VELVADVAAKQVGRNHQWVITVGVLKVAQAGTYIRHPE
jgi:hypothetical protein